MEKENKKTIEVPFGARDSELHEFEYNIPEGYEAEIKDGKVIVKKKESEDEMIRKELIEYLTHRSEVTGFIDEDKDCKRWIAYLEKQKDKVVEFDHDREQQPAKEDGPFDEDKFLEGELAAFLQNYDKEYDDDAAISDVAIHFYELGKKMKQKPAEWSEDYREEDIQTRFAFYTYKDDPSVLYLSNVFVEETSRNHGFGTRILKAAEKVAETIGAITICLKVKQDSPANAWYRKHGYGYVTFEDGYDWLKKNLEYLKPAKSTEWSEEDENTLECSDSFKRFVDMVHSVDKGEFTEFEYSIINFVLACCDKNIAMTPKGIHCYAKTILNIVKKEFTPKNCGWTDE